MSQRFDQLRLLEALLFASPEPLRISELARHLPEGVEIDGLLEELQGLYANRGVHLTQIGERWAFRTAADLASSLKLERKVIRKLSRVAMETLAIIAYHQPVTRAEIEEIRGVGLSKGTLDLLLEMGWIKPKGRRRTPGRPVTWGTAEAFLDHFGLASLDTLPGVEELKAAGLLDARPALSALAARGELAPAEETSPDENLADEDPEEGEALPEGFGETLLAHEEPAHEERAHNELAESASAQETMDNDEAAIDDIDAGRDTQETGETEDAETRPGQETRAAAPSQDEEEALLGPSARQNF